MRLNYKFVVAATLLAFTNIVNAHCHDTKYYVGGGVGLNSQSNADSTGFQFLGGYCLNNNFHNNKTKTAFEVGYMDTGDFDTTTGGGGKKGNTVQVGNAYQGLWLSGLAEYKLEKN